MRRSSADTFLLVIAAAACGISCGGQDYQPRDGDLLFQESTSAQSPHIKAITNSRYTHMGVVFLVDGRASVYEAIGPVTLTPLDDWIRRGRDEHYVAMRLRDPTALAREGARSALLRICESFAGRPYDFCFRWDDDALYCSELAWKAYHRALGLELGQPQTFSKFLPLPPGAADLMRARCPDGIDSEEKIISPRAMIESEKLIEVHRSGKVDSAQMSKD